MNKREIVFSGIGMFTSAGSDVAENWNALKNPIKREKAEDYLLSGFNPKKYLQDKRMLKAVSKPDAVGLSAIEAVKAELGYDLAEHDEWKVGIYVGAPSGSASDNDNYIGAINETRGEKGGFSEHKFGQECMRARPTTLLLGLPNNVLCYGSIIMNAKGPNSNYTSSETGGHLAVLNAARRIKYGKIDAAVAGGFSNSSDPVLGAMYEKKNMIKKPTESGEHKITPYGEGEKGTVLADGAAFVMLETRERVEERGGKVLASFVSSSAATSNTGIFGKCDTAAVDSSSLVYAIEDCLASGGIAACEVGIVFSSASGIGYLDGAELEAVDKVFGRETPAFATTARVWGNMMEAGGVGEIGLLSPIYQEGTLPESMVVNGSDTVSSDKPYALIIRASMWGEWTCLLVKKGEAV